MSFILFAYRGIASMARRKALNLPKIARNAVDEQRE